MNEIQQGMEQELLAIQSEMKQESAASDDYEIMSKVYCDQTDRLIQLQKLELEKTKLLAEDNARNSENELKKHELELEEQRLQQEKHSKWWDRGFQMAATVGVSIIYLVASAYFSEMEIHDNEMISNTPAKEARKKVFDVTRFIKIR